MLQVSSPFAGSSLYDPRYRPLQVSTSSSYVAKQECMHIPPCITNSADCLQHIRHCRWGRGTHRPQVPERGTRRCHSGPVLAGAATQPTPLPAAPLPGASAGTTPGAAFARAPCRKVQLYNWGHDFTEWDGLATRMCEFLALPTAVRR